jgi:hypothetical protein
MLILGVERHEIIEAQLPPQFPSVFRRQASIKLSKALPGFVA